MGDIARLRYWQEHSERWRGDMVRHLSGHSPHWAWGVEWIWVGGYSAAATTILLLNVILFISIIRNRYLHYSFNYVVFALSFRWWNVLDNARQYSDVVETFVVFSSHCFSSSWPS